MIEVVIGTKFARDLSNGLQREAMHTEMSHETCFYEPQKGHK